MTRVDTKDGAGELDQAEFRPYSPSWVDYLSDWVNRRRGPSWTYYAAIGVIVLSIQTATLWIEGAPIDRVGLAQVYLALAIAYILALIRHLDRRAVLALATMRPALEASERKQRDMGYRLSTLPALATLVASLAAVAFVVLTEAISEPYRPESLDPFPISAAVMRVCYLIGWFVFGAFLFHTFHQLRVINEIYTRHTRIDIFRAKPLYAFSNLAALTAGSLAMISYGWLLANPWIDQSDPLVFVPMVILLLFAAVTFVWPQLGIHRLQVNEKDRLLDEAALRFEAAIRDLHRKMDDEELEGVMDLNMAMASLELELNALKKTPTWPWEPEVVQLLFTALALPLALWLIQLILQSTLGH